MESGSEGSVSNSGSEGDISTEYSKFIEDRNYSGSLVVDVKVNPIKHVESSACNDDFDDDEHNDLLEEQILLKKTKCSKDYRTSLACYRDAELDKVDHHVNPNAEKNRESKISPVCIDNNSCDNDNITDDDKILESISTIGATDSRQLFETCDHFEIFNKLNKALSINVSMLSELEQFYSVLMKRRKEVMKEQIEVRAEISRLKWLEEKDANKKRKKSKAYRYTLFGIPYFKDEQKYLCPKNEDAKMMKQKNQILTIHLPPSRPWRMVEMYQLQEGVRKILLEEQINKFHETEKELENNTASDSTMNKELRSELQSTNNQVALLENKSLKELFFECDPNREFDWHRIAANDVPKHSFQECQSMWNIYVKPTINKTEFTKDEENNLKKLIEKFGEQNWDVVAKKLGTSRSEYQCFLHYQMIMRKGKTKCGKWTKEEDEKLLRIIKKFRNGEIIPWRKVALHFEDRSLHQLYIRWTYSLNPDLKKGHFNKEEDQKILSYVRKHGENFSKISKLLGHRSTTQIRQRYFLIKKTNGNVGRWSLQEDQLLLALVEQYGVSNWSEISKNFKIRTRTQIRQRYKAITNLLKKNPDRGIADFPRGPTARSQHLIPVSTAEVKAASMEQENKMNSELVEENRMKNKVIPNHDIATTKLKRGRKKHIKKSKVDVKLTEYFKEVLCPDELKLRTRILKPDIDKAATALLLFCRYFKTSLILSGDEFEEGIKKFPKTLKRVIFRMIGDERGRDNFETNLDVTADSVVSHSNHLASINRDQLIIDYVPVDPRETLVSDTDYLLSANKEETDLDEVAIDGKISKNSNVIPYFLPPNIITMIGCRSIMLMKGKILTYLANRCTRPTYFPPKDMLLMKKNNLKFSTAYFSDDESDDDDVPNCDDKINEENPDPVINNKKEFLKVQSDGLKISVSNSPHNTDVLVSPTSLMKTLLADHSGDLRLSVSSNPLSNSNEIVPPLPSSSKVFETAFSVPSTSKVCDPPSTPTLFSDTPILSEFDSDKHTGKKFDDEILNIRTKRLTKQEAIDLWKERLTALFCLPLAFANHAPNFSTDENEGSEAGNVNEVKHFKNPSYNKNSKSTSDNVLPVKENIKSFNSEKSNLLQNCLSTGESQSKRQHRVTSKKKSSSTATHELPCMSNIEVEQRQTSGVADKQTSVDKQCTRSKNKLGKRKKISIFTEIISHGSNVPQHSDKIAAKNSVTQESNEESEALRAKQQRKSNNLL